MKACLLALLSLVLLISIQGVAQVPRTLSYQGVLTDTLGNPKADGTYSLTFRLYDVSSGGTQLWEEQKTLQLKRGLFHTILGDQVVFGSALKFDKPYWLGVRVASDPEMVPRIPLTAVGYSLNAANADTAQFARSAPAQGFVDSARVAGTLPNGAVTSGKIAGGQVVKSLNNLKDDVTISGGTNVVVSQNGNNLVISSTSGNGGLPISFKSPHLALFYRDNGIDSLVYTIRDAVPPNTTDDTVATWRDARMIARSSGSVPVPLSLKNNSNSQATIYGENDSSGSGVYGLSWDGPGVVGSGHPGVSGSNSIFRGVEGYSHSSNGVYGYSDQADAVVGAKPQGDPWLTSGAAVYGKGNYAYTGVLGEGGDGVVGRSTAVGGVWSYGAGVAGMAQGTYAEHNEGVAGTNDGAGVGVLGYSKSGTGIYGSREGGGDFAGYFSGNVQVTGSLTKGSGAFKIDHPLDPANKYLYHSFVESPDMKNVYDGIVVLDGNGEAQVGLPSYFQSLNADFRYQLTCIGGYAPVYISKEVSQNSFGISGGKPGLKVSWQVTGIRQDPFAKAHRIVPETEKPQTERGKYLFPVEYGVSESLGTQYEQIQNRQAQQKRLDEMFEQRKLREKTSEELQSRK